MATDTPFESLRYSDKIWLQERRKRTALLIKHIYNEVKDRKILDVAMGKWSLVKDPSLPPDEFYLLDIEKDLPFKDGEFSMVFAGEIIEHLGYQSAHNLLKEISRVLRTNGYLLLTTPNGFRNRLKEILKRPKVAAHEKEFSFREIKKMLVKMGFEVIHSDGIQPVFIPWSVTIRFASLKLPGFLSSQLIFLCQKNLIATI